MKKAELIKEVASLRNEVKRLKTATNRVMSEKKKETDRFERVKSRFVEAVAHELRTPVTPLKSVIEMFLDGMLGDIEPKQREYLEMMHRNVERLTHFISEITSFSKLDSDEATLRPEQISVLSIIAATVEEFRKKAKKKDIFISLGTQTELFAFADADAVRVIVTQLIENAIMHNPQGTTVKIGTRLSGGDFVEVNVSDNGRGIPDDELETIFERLSPLRREHGPGYRGIGIGLSVCKKLIEGMGGSITVESVESQGTTFRFILPIKRNRVNINSH